MLIACLLWPSLGGKRTEASWPARIRALPDLMPPLVIFLAVIGSIYAGLATATESAALGVIAALGVAAWHRSLTLRMLLHAFEGTMRTTAMIMAILIAAYFLNFVISSIGLTAQVNRFVTGLGLSADRAADRGHHLLPRPRLLHGDALHDGRDRADHRADHVQGGLRPGLVRRADHHPDGDRR